MLLIRTSSIGSPRATAPVFAADRPGVGLDSAHPRRVHVRDLRQAMERAALLGIGGGTMSAIAPAAAPAPRHRGAVLLDGDPPGARFLIPLPNS